MFFLFRAKYAKKKADGIVSLLVLTRLFVVVLFVFLFFGDSFAHLFK